MRTIKDKLTKIMGQSAKAQSLVEMAIIFPILMFMLMGVFEVGWVLRNYLVLVNLDRELARFSIRPGYLDFSIKDPAEVGYNLVLSHTETITGQLAVDFETNSTLIISHIVVDTGLPCLREEIESNCDCNKFGKDDNYGKAQSFTYDDIILHPLTPGYSYFTRTFPITPTITSSDNLSRGTRLDYTQVTTDLVSRNNKLNCEFVKKQGPITETTPLETSPNNVIIVEVAYDQPQLFGFPIIANPYTDPVPLYAQTTMRLIAGARSAAGTKQQSLVGPLCNALPWYVTKGTLTTPGTVYPDVLEGWVRWGTSNPNHPGETSDDYLQYELVYPQMAMNDFKDGAEDITTGKDVAGFISPSGVTEGEIDTLMRNTRNGFIKQPLLIPVLDGNTIADFALIQIEVPEDINILAGTIQATYLGSGANGAYCEGAPLP